MSANSSGEVMRLPKGTRFSMALRVSSGLLSESNHLWYWGVMHSAGSTQLTRILSGASAMAHSRVSAFMAPLAAA